MDYWLAEALAIALSTINNSPLLMLRDVKTPLPLSLVILI